MGCVVVSGVLLDTYALVWLVEGVERLGPESRRLADDAAKQEELLVSAITFWEVAMLAQRERLVLTRPVAEWRRSVLEIGIAEAPLSGHIGILATELDGLPQDPADRMIVATAMEHGATLVTADRPLLGWPGGLPRHDAGR